LGKFAKKLKLQKDAILAYYNCCILAYYNYDV